MPKITDRNFFDGAMERVGRLGLDADAVKAVERVRAQDLPLAVLGLEHDGPGTALKKRQTRQGRAGT